MSRFIVAVVVVGWPSFCQMHVGSHRGALLGLGWRGNAT